QSTFGTFSSTSIFTASRRTRAVYAQALAALPSATIAIGGRSDDNEAFGRFDTYRVGANWRPAGATRLRASAGTAFREPSFFENFATGFVKGNPGLSPERTASVEVGLAQSLLDERVVIEAT